MKPSTRDRMIEGASDLLRRRGVNATSLREVVRHSETPRGSLAHHFPGGKQELVQQALLNAGQEVSDPLERLIAQSGVITGLRNFIEAWRRVLEDSSFEAGCPVLAVAVEQYLGDDGVVDRSAQEKLLDVVWDVFQHWQRILFDGLRREGIKSAQARRLATLVVSSVEGTVALCRAGRSVQPLIDVRIELEGLLTQALATASPGRVPSRRRTR